jgi:hypothetical protein
VERAQAWDLAEFAQWQQKLAKDVYFECEFASKLYRLWVLNAYCDFLAKIVLQSFDSDPHVTMRDKMVAIKLSQDLMGDMRREMTRLEDPFSRR